MDQQTNKQEPSSTEGGEVKVGDKVWVRATVGNADADRPGWFNFWFTGNNGIYLPASDCRPVEPSNPPKILDSSSDPINPFHYKQGGIECIEAIKAATGDGFIGYVWGNVLKYLWRWPKKGGVDDLKKARWYLDRLIQEAGE
jgi:hypothetical protein